MPRRFAIAAGPNMARSCLICAADLPTAFALACPRAGERATAGGRRHGPAVPTWRGTAFAAPATKWGPGGSENQSFRSKSACPDHRSSDLTVQLSPRSASRTSGVKAAPIHCWTTRFPAGCSERSSQPDAAPVSQQHA